MTIFKANFSTGNSILFSGSRDSHDIYKWVATQRSLGYAALVFDILWPTVSPLVTTY